MADAKDQEDSSSSKRCWGGWQFDGVQTAKGYNLLGMGRGPIIMSNVFLASALIYLASEEVGCTEEVWDETTNTTSWEVVEDCDEQVFGVFRPAALITNIAVISGLLSALFMPVIGAIVDYTPYRWMVGVVSAVLIVLVQGIQIGTGSNTWFAMSILQALTGFFYQVTVLATYAYLPDISGVVGERKMTSYTSIFTMLQFTAQSLFLILVIGPSMGFGWDDVATAQASQALNTVWTTIAFYLGWRLMPKVDARHVLPEGRSLFLQGFRQNWNTAKRIHQDYKKGLRWFLLALVFAEAAANSFTVVAVVFLDEQLGMTGSEIGIFFLVTLVAMIPGGKIGSFVTNKTNPNTSWRLSMLVLFGLGVFGGVVLKKENDWPIGYIWGILVGLCLGWFYPTESLFFSMIIPKGQEAELAGIFVYCTQIIGWLPPLMFSIMVENNVDQGYGMIVVSSFALISIAILSMASSWPEIVEDVRSADEPEDAHKTDEEEVKSFSSTNEDATIPSASITTLNSAVGDSEKPAQSKEVAKSVRVDATKNFKEREKEQKERLKQKKEAKKQAGKQLNAFEKEVVGKVEAPVPDEMADTNGNMRISITSLSKGISSDKGAVEVEINSLEAKTGNETA